MLCGTGGFIDVFLSLLIADSLASILWVPLKSYKIPDSNVDWQHNMNTHHMLRKGESGIPFPFPLTTLGVPASILRAPLRSYKIPASNVNYSHTECSGKVSKCHTCG